MELYSRLISATREVKGRFLNGETAWFQQSAGRDAGQDGIRVLRLKRFWAILLLPLSLGLVSFASNHPAITEHVFSAGIYPVIAGFFGRITSLFPFSFAQWLVIAAPILLVFYIVRQVRQAIHNKEQRLDRLERLIATLLCIAGTGYFLFTVTCGLNYHRLGFADISGLEVRPSSGSELTALCEELVEEANRLRASVIEDENGVMITSFDSSHAASDFAQTGYRQAGEEYPVLGGYTVRPKPVLFSRAMSYLDITGIFTFYTFEANINVDVPDFWIPSTMMHELAHFKGFMREDEANFVSFLACRSAGDDEFAYSGTVLALIHSSNALYSADRDTYWQVMDRLSDGARRDLDANSEYWKQFEGPVAEVSSAVNDVYLKSNRQSNGVKSYGRMVDLLLAEYRQRHEQ